LRHDPNYADAYESRGRAYAARGDQDRAIVDYDKAIALRGGT
jgi:Tfp pilus assembly protein PilF